ncbi:MAG: amino acid ABC transporter permease [Solirubrobacteraceae bacterium]
MSTSELPTQAPERPDDIEAVPVRHPWRWVAAVIIVIIAASLIRSAVNDAAFNWHLFGQYLFDPRILRGVVTTIWLTVLSMVLGIALGTVLAVMRLSPNRLVSGFSWLYIWFFRGTPLLVQILFWSFIGALYRRIEIGVPFGGPALINADANSLISATVGVILALSLNEGAYMAEIVRAGIISVSEGQTEAAQSLGLSRLQTMRLIVLPQAIRVIVPPTGNEVISMLKNTSLASVVAFTELLYSVQLIYSVNYKQIPLLMVAVLWYLVMTSVLYVGQHFLERRYGRGFTRAQRATMRARWLGFGNRESMG